MNTHLPRRKKTAPSWPIFRTPMLVPYSWLSERTKKLSPQKSTPSPRASLTVTLPAMMVSATCFGDALPRTQSGFKRSLIKFPISTSATGITELPQLTTLVNNAVKDISSQVSPTQVKSPSTTLWLFFTPLTTWLSWTTTDFLNPSTAWPQSNLLIK